MKEKTLIIVHTVDALGEPRDVIVRERHTLDDLVKAKKLYPTDVAAKMFGLTVPYVRRLCKAGKVNAERILGRYYFTPKQIAELQKPIRI